MGVGVGDPAAPKPLEGAVGVEQVIGVVDTVPACFDGKLKLLGVRLLSEGSPSANEISLRKIATEALALGATAVVLAHNHPSGIATPSQEDIFITHYIRDALQPLGITLYDHVIMTDDDMVSLKDSRHLNSF